jgi:hypothetical protein
MAQPKQQCAPVMPSPVMATQTWCSCTGCSRCSPIVHVSSKPTNLAKRPCKRLLAVAMYRCISCCRLVHALSAEAPQGSKLFTQQHSTDSWGSNQMLLQAGANA